MLHRLKRRKGRLKQRSCQKKRKRHLMRLSHLEKEKSLTFSQKERLLKMHYQHVNSRRSRQKMEHKKIAEEEKKGYART